MSKAKMIRRTVTVVLFGNDTGGYTDEKGMIAIPNEAAQMRLSHICYVWERNLWMGE